MKKSSVDSSILGIIMAFSGAIFDSLASRLQMGIYSNLRPSPFEVMFFCSFYSFVFGLAAGKKTQGPKIRDFHRRFELGLGAV